MFRSSSLVAVLLVVVGCGGRKATPGNDDGGADGATISEGTGGSPAVDAAGTGGNPADAAGGGAADGPTLSLRDVVDDGAGGDHCIGWEVVAPGASGMIADFEDGTGNVLPIDGRTGSFFTYGDPGCLIAKPPFLPVAPVAGKTTQDKSKLVWEATASNCSTYGFATVVSLNAHSDPLDRWYSCAYDVSAYDGVYFWAYGDGLQIWASLGLRTTSPAFNGGDNTCLFPDAGPVDGGSAPGCYDEYTTPFDLVADWKLYSLRWSDLMQGGWGTPTAWNAKLVTTLRFSVSADQTIPKAIFYIDNVGFFKGSPPTATP